MDPTAPEKKGSRHNPQDAGWSICGFVPSFSPRSTNEVIGLIQTSIDDKLLGLLSSYHQHTIGTFNTCSQGPTHRALTDTGESYNLGDASLPRTTPRPYQPMVFTFHIRTQPDHQFNQMYQIIQVEFKGHMVVTWSSDHSAIYRGLHLRLAIAIDLSLAIEFTWIDWKVVLMQLGYQSNSYNLMHIQES
jgi:hypothetical protein